MTETGNATVKVSLDWTGVADDMRAIADRIDPSGAAMKPAESPGYVSIPWPPSDELVERCVESATETLGRLDQFHSAPYAVTRAVLDVIGGGDE